MANDLDLYQDDVETSIAERAIRFVFSDDENHWGYREPSGVVHWAIYRHVEMMDKHIHMFNVKTHYHYGE